MYASAQPTTNIARVRIFLKTDLGILFASIAVQAVLGYFFGHLYDMRIFMATGFLVGSGQNPYIPQDLSAIFHNPYLQGMTTVGYPPPWPLLLGLIYRLSYSIIPNFLAYNLAIKIPIIAANIGLAYLVESLILKLGGDTLAARKARIFMLFNPFLLYSSAAWGQFDSIVALISLYSLVLLESGKVKRSAILLALAISFKPIALPLIPIAFIYLYRKSIWQNVFYYSVLFVSIFVFSVVPFFIMKWDPSPILQNWNAHFIVGGGMSFMTFFEFFKNSYQLTGNWRLAGVLWIPALCLATYTLRSGKGSLRNLIINSSILIMVFFLTRAWLSEPNIILILPFILILTSTGNLNRVTLAAIWILPLVFSILNTSTAQLFFPSMPELMDGMLKWMEGYRPIRLAAKMIIVIPWQLLGWWIVFHCYRTIAVPSEKALA